MKQHNKYLPKILVFTVVILVAYKIFPLLEEQVSALNTAMILKILFFITLLWFIIHIYSSRSSQGPGSIGHILLWVTIFVILIIIYAFRFELESLKDRVLAVLIPSYSWTNEQGQLVIARNKDGHFYLDARTRNKSKIKFLIDTGASDIALTKDAAIKLGFNPSKLQYTKKYYTANGISYAAPVRIRQLTIDKKTFYNLEAHVTSGELDISLLGMSLIDDFKDFKITNDLLILSY